MKSLSLKFRLIAMFAVVVFGTTVPYIATKVTAQSGECLDNESVILSDEILTNGTYRVWALVRNVDGGSGARPFLRIDNGQCIEMTSLTGTEWQWVPARTGSGILELVAGRYDIALSSESGSYHADKVLATNDLDCIPEDDGSNCIVDPLGFDILGIVPQIQGDRSVQVNVYSTDEIDQATARFYLNGELIRQVTGSISEPFCLAANPTTRECVPYSFGSMPRGDYTLRVVVEAGEQSGEKSQSFRLVEPEQVAPPPGSNDGVNQDSLPWLPYTITGITDGETVTGTRKIQAVIENVTVPVSVRFKVNNQIIVDRFSAPYCFVEGAAGTCGDWDSAAYPNGEHTLYFIATANGYKDSWIPIKIRIDNASVVNSSNLPKESSKQVTVGKAKQQVSGIVKVTIDKARVSSGARVELKLGDTVVGEVLGSNIDTATIDTSVVPNGSQTLTASIINPDETIDVIKSEVIVRNDSLTSMSNWLQANLLRTVIVIIVLSGGLFMLIRYVLQLREKRSFNDRHNIAETYQYTAPGEQTAHKTYAMNAVFALAFVMGGVFFVRGIETTSASTNLGFVSEVELSTSVPDGFDYVDEIHTGPAYITIITKQLTSNPVPPTPPTTPTTPPATPPQTLVNTNPLPVGLKIVAGNARATGPQDVPVRWECGGQNSPSIPPCTGNLRATVIFPICWDGVNLDSENHISHLRYGRGDLQASTGNPCPETHRYILPEISVQFDYDVNGTSGFRLSSDMYDGPGGYSLHADFFSGWNPEICARWLRNCTSRNADCHVGQVGDGLQLVPHR